MNVTLANASDTLFTSAIAIYSLAMVAFCGEYAFGRRGRIATTALAQAPARVLEGAGGPPVIEEPADSSVDARTDASADPASKADVASTADSASTTDRASKADRFGRIGLAITIIGALLHATSLTMRGVAVDRVPWGNMYEFSSAAGLIAVVSFLVVLVRQPKVRFLGLFVMLPVIVLMFLAGTVLYAKAAPLIPPLQSYWLAIHVSAAAIGTGIFMTSSVATILYLIRRRWETASAAGRSVRFPITIGRRLPDPAAMDRVAYRTVAFGFPLYTFGVIAGAIWAEAAWGRYWGWDPKETWAFITWVVYAAYLHARATAGWKGTKASYINLLGFTTMIFNFFIVNIVVSGLHSYAGIN